MKQIIYSVITITLTLGLVTAQSGGCGKNPPTRIGKLDVQYYSMKDPATGNTYNRTYHVDLPKGYQQSKNTPLIL
jgi:hypothetical protein